MSHNCILEEWKKNPHHTQVTPLQVNKGNFKLSNNKEHYMYDGDIGLRYVMLPVIMRHSHSEINYIHMNILYVDHYI